MTAPEKRIGGASYYAAQTKAVDESEDALIGELSPVIKDIEANISKYIRDKEILTNPNKNATAIEDMKIPAGLRNQITEISKKYMYDQTYAAYEQAMKEVSQAIENGKSLPATAEYGSVAAASCYGFKDITSLDAVSDASAIKQMEDWKSTRNWRKMNEWRAKRIEDLAGTHATQGKFWISGKVETAMLNEVKDELIAGLSDMKSEAQTMKEVTKVFEKYGTKPDLIKPYKIQRIVRTNTTRAIADARREAFSDPEVVEAFPAMMYSAIMDDRTSDICAELDESVYRNDDPIWNEILPPRLHINCRSTVIAVSEDELKESGVSKAPPADLIKTPQENIAA
jgi:SPP1 gp7 family putative phage head morphogenesis protein